MASMLICDGCGATGGITRQVPRVGFSDTKKVDASPEWWTVTVSGKGILAQSYDLCPPCFRRAEVAVKNTGAEPTEPTDGHPPPRIRGLSAVEVNLLRQIWHNAQGFDQSIGDIK